MQTNEEITNSRMFKKLRKWGIPEAEARYFCVEQFRSVPLNTPLKKAVEFRGAKHTWEKINAYRWKRYLESLEKKKDTKKTNSGKKKKAKPKKKEIFKKEKTNMQSRFFVPVRLDPQDFSYRFSAAFDELTNIDPTIVNPILEYAANILFVNYNSSLAEIVLAVEHSRENPPLEDENQETLRRNVQNYVRGLIAFRPELAPPPRIPVQQEQVQEQANEEQIPSQTFPTSTDPVSMGPLSTIQEASKGESGTQGNGNAKSKILPVQEESKISDQPVNLGPDTVRTPRLMGSVRQEKIKVKTPSDDTPSPVPEERDEEEKEDNRPK